MAHSSRLLAAALTPATLVLAACANDRDQTLDAGSSGREGPGATHTATGAVTVQLEPVDGVFIEGFEIGLRFETETGDVLGSTLWTDYVNEHVTDPSMEDYYNSVLRQQVPAGPVVVLATVNIGAGPPPEIPDLAGDLSCRLSIDIPADGEVAVEVGFDGQDDCLRVLAAQSPPARASCGSFDVDEAWRTDPAALVAGYECLGDAFETRGTVTLHLVFTDGEGNRVPTSYTAEDGRVVVVRQLPTGEEHEVCSELVGDHDGTLYPEECRPADATNPKDTSASTAADHDLIGSFLRFAAEPGPDSAALVPFADEVALGLGNTLSVDQRREGLADAGAWSIDVDELFRGYDGPFSALEIASEAQDVVVSLGPHAHCASPPVAPPEEVADLRRVSVQPAPGSIDTCLRWWSVDLFVTPEGEVAAVTLDIWEP